MEAKVNESKSGGSIPLFLTKPGDIVTVTELSGGTNFRQKIIDMGIVPGQKIEIVVANRNQPFVIKVNNTRLMVGYGMGRKIMVKF